MIRNLYGSFSDEVLYNKPINIPASPRRDTLADDEDARDSDDEETLPTIKFVYSMTSMYRF